MGKIGPYLPGNVIPEPAWNRVNNEKVEGIVVSLVVGNVGVVVLLVWLVETTAGLIERLGDVEGVVWLLIWRGLLVVVPLYWLVYNFITFFSWYFSRF